MTVLVDLLHWRIDIDIGARDLGEELGQDVLEHVVDALPVVLHNELLYSIDYLVAVRHVRVMLALGTERLAQSIIFLLTVEEVVSRLSDHARVGGEHQLVLSSFGHSL